MLYYVVNTENKKALFGPLQRRDADLKHYEVCAHGIVNSDTGISSRPRCAVVCEDAFLPTEHGNHYSQLEVIKGTK